MKKIILALFLLAAATCYLDGYQLDGMQIIYYRRNNFGLSGQHFLKPLPILAGTPSIPFASGECPYHYRPRPNEYILSFDWAPRNKGTRKLQSSQGLVKIGSQIIADLQVECSNTGVRHAEFSLTLENGENTLTFEGTGKSDRYGISVTNVVIRRKNSRQNLLINGDFSSPCVGFGKWRYFRGGIQGWSADVAEVGDCRIYNSDWKGGQCIELDSNRNQYYTQKFRVGAC